MKIHIVSFQQVNKYASGELDKKYTVMYKLLTNSIKLQNLYWNPFFSIFSPIVHTAIKPQ